MGMRISSPSSKQRSEIYKKQSLDKLLPTSPPFPASRQPAPEFRFRERQRSPARANRVDAADRGGARHDFRAEDARSSGHHSVL